MGIRLEQVAMTVRRTPDALAAIQYLIRALEEIEKPATKLPGMPALHLRSDRRACDLANQSPTLGSYGAKTCRGGVRPVANGLLSHVSEYKVRRMI
jgi:hypothetical protein